MSVDKRIAISSKVIALSEVGYTQNSIAGILKITQSKASRILARYRDTGYIGRKMGSGRPNKAVAAVKRKILIENY